MPLTGRWIGHLPIASWLLQHMRNCILIRRIRVWRIRLPPMPEVPECPERRNLIYYKYTPKPKYGYLNLAKRGATTHEVLIGATYHVYSDASCTSYANDIYGESYAACEFHKCALFQHFDLCGRGPIMSVRAVNCLRAQGRIPLFIL